MQWMIALPKIQTYSVITCKINRPKTLFSRFKPAESQQKDPSIVASSVIRTVLPLTASNQNRSIRTIKLSCFAFSGRVSSLWPWPQRRESKGLVDSLNNSPLLSLNSSGWSFAATVMALLITWNILPVAPLRNSLHWFIPSQFIVWISNLTRQDFKQQDFEFLRISDWKHKISSSYQNS